MGGLGSILWARDEGRGQSRWVSGCEAVCVWLDVSMGGKGIEWVARLTYTKSGE